MEKIHNPHDLYFKETMSKAENARSFLDSCLAPEIRSLLALDRLEVEKDSFVAPELAEYVSDMLYQVPLCDGRRGHVYILLEHKSFADPWVALQILEYMVQCWRTARTEYLARKKREKEEAERNPEQPKIAQGEFHLPVIIPIVLYHGTHAWNYGSNSGAMFDCPPALQRFIPDFSYVMYDLVKTDEKQIDGNPYVQIMLRIFKFVRTPLLADKLATILSEFAGQISTDNLSDTVKTIVSYLLNAGNIEPKQLAGMIVSNFGAQGGDIVMTTAEKLREEGKIEGKIEGIKEGEIKGKIEAALEIKFGARGLHRMNQIRLLQDLEQLNCIFLAAKTAISIEAFEDELKKLM